LLNFDPTGQKNLPSAMQQQAERQAIWVLDVYKKIVIDTSSFVLRRMCGVYLGCFRMVTPIDAIKLQHAVLCSKGEFPNDGFEFPKDGFGVPNEMLRCSNNMKPAH